eukprot:SAG25_NODE_139_length_14140_cov_7.185101_3_plen_120_part_00
MAQNTNTLTPQDAMSSMYYITWMTEAAPCSGAGTSDDANGVTTWHAYNGLLYTDVQFAQGAHAFSTTPVIVSSLHGTTVSHWLCWWRHTQLTATGGLVLVGPCQCARRQQHLSGLTHRL